MKDETNEPGTGYQSRTPVNVGAPLTDDDIGFVIVELREGALKSYDRDLALLRLHQVSVKCAKP